MGPQLTSTTCIQLTNLTAREGPRNDGMAETTSWTTRYFKYGHKPWWGATQTTQIFLSTFTTNPG